MDARTSGQAQEPAAPETRRRRPIGAEVVPGLGVHFRVWAPKRKTVEVVIEGGPGSSSSGQHAAALQAEPNGYFSGLVTDAGPGTLYRFRLDGSRDLVIDPASRFQADGPHGPSQVVNPSAFAWKDADWCGPGSTRGQVLYELHVGTFTPEGTWKAAEAELPYLASLGVTTLELMPVHEFPGAFGWSYDGVDLFAPFHHYGTPDDFRRFVDEAHALRLGVLLDVVYNHLGPDGNVLKQFSDDYFSTRHVTEWGEALNFDGENSGPVREFILANVAYWVDEFHVDGIRVDATQSLFDMAEDHDHILLELMRAIREAAGGRGCPVLVVAESEPQRATLVRPESRGGLGYDMVWSDDFHHVAMVAATGCREGYYGDYLGKPQEFVSVLKRGWLYQGQWDLRQSKRRGTAALDIPPPSFLFYLQNHDQIANSAYGERIHQLTTPGRYRALTALLLLAPETPLLFQGQEYAASTPFHYFGDHKPEVAAGMLKGRKDFLLQFPSLATPAMQARVPNPADPEVFHKSKLDPSERERGRHAEALAMHRDLIRLRRDDTVFRLQRLGLLDGAVLGPEALVLRWFGPDHEDRLLLVNLGVELRLDVAPEPLLAPPSGTKWRAIWSSDDPRYGGPASPEPEAEALNWRLNGHSAVALASEPFDGDEHRNFPGTV